MKKIRCASLVETLTATVIIVVVFIIASSGLNNLFINNLNRDDFKLENRLSELKYFLNKDQLTLPYYEEESYWIIQIERIEDYNSLTVKNKNSREDKFIKIIDE